MQFGAFIGLDWADEEHALSLCAANDTQIQRTTLKQTPEAIAQWANELRTRFPNQFIAIALEQSRGPLLAALTNFEHIVPHPVNPKSLARFRQALYPSNSKDDITDADLLLEILLKHRDHLRPWQPDTVHTRQLALLTEQRRNLVDTRTALTNQLLAHLKMIFPQALDFVGDLAPLGRRFPEEMAHAAVAPESNSCGVAEVLLRPQLSGQWSFDAAIGIAQNRPCLDLRSGPA